MSNELLLVLAEIDGNPIAGALNFIGMDALYGRYWGCTENYSNLHFEICYYQAIEYAMKTAYLGLKRVHKETISWPEDICQVIHIRYTG